MARRVSQARPPSWPAPPPSAHSRQLSSSTARTGPSSIPSRPASTAESFGSAEPSPVEVRPKLSVATNHNRTDNSGPDFAAVQHSDAGGTTPRMEPATGGQEQSSDRPVLPMTPKSPDVRSPAVGLSALADKPALPARSTANQDIEIVDQLLDMMKHMLGTLGSTFDVLGEQTIKVATLPTAIDAMHQVYVLCYECCRSLNMSCVMLDSQRSSAT